MHRNIITKVSFILTYMILGGLLTLLIVELLLNP